MDSIFNLNRHFLGIQRTLNKYILKKEISSTVNLNKIHV